MFDMIKLAGLIFTGTLFLACLTGKVSAPAYAHAPGPVRAPAPAPAPGPAPGPAPASAPVSANELDAAVRETSDYLNKQLPKGNKLVILNIQSEFPALSEYIIDELIANTVNDRVFSVVDRRQLDTIRAELNFQMSGEVDDKTAQSVGQMAGAQIIVSGAVSRIGDLYRLRVRALSVQSAEIEGQFNRNIQDNATIAALVKSRATGYGATGGAVGGGNYGGSGGRPTTAAVPAAVPAPVPAGSAKPDTAPAHVSAPVQAVPAQAAAPAPAPAPAAEKVYQIGDTGPAGGIVFYDKFSSAGGWRYMEAAPKVTEQKFPWGAVTLNLSPALGDGKRNTQLIVEALREAKSGGAAQYCDDLEYGGYTDWFLPSRDELDLMYRNLKEKSLGGFTNNTYWSSYSTNHYGGRHYYYQRFSDGVINETSGQAEPFAVRAIRQF
jgi:curli biogenesis system outer membrane secretion channel CsgG